MTLVLNNSEIRELLPMQDCLRRLDEAYREIGREQAGNRPRSDIYGPVHDNGRYVFKSMDGLLPRFEVAATRLNSDVIRWQRGAHGLRKDKQATAPGGKFCGLILLFSTRNGAPLAIMPDGVLERSALNVVHTRIGRPANYIIGKGQNPIYDHDPQEGLADDLKEVRGTGREIPTDWLLESEHP
jgi:hypothetical protein